MTAQRDIDDSFEGGVPARVSFVDLYVFGIETGQVDLGRLGCVLSPDERERASRIRAPGASDRYRSARVVLRHVLAGYTDGLPGELSFSYGAHGKPALEPAGARPFFNLSHSGGIGAIAVSKDFDVGIDIEAWRDVSSGIAGRFFSKAEVAALSQYSTEQRKSAFFRCWTRKEAVIKALGAGFSKPLDSFDVSIEDVSAPDLLRIEGETHEAWRLFSFSPRANVSGAIAVRSGTRSVELRTCPVGC